MTEHKIIPCCICNRDIEHKKDENGNVYWSQGHNAQPIMQGRCCDRCNNYIVVASRIEEFLARQREDLK